MEFFAYNILPALILLGSLFTIVLALAGACWAFFKIVN